MYIARACVSLCVLYCVVVGRCVVLCYVVVW